MDMDGSKISPELKEFIVNEQIKSQIQAQIKKLNNICFDKCIEKATTKLESKQETCVTNCVEVFLASNGFIANRFARRSTNVSSDSFA